MSSSGYTPRPEPAKANRSRTKSLQGSLIRKHPPLGPYRRPMPRPLWWLYGGVHTGHLPTEIGAQHLWLSHDSIKSEPTPCVHTQFRMSSFSSSSLLLSSLELRVMQKFMSLEYEPFSEPLHVSETLHPIPPPQSRMFSSGFAPRPEPAPADQARTRSLQGYLAHKKTHHPRTLP